MTQHAWRAWQLAHEARNPRRIMNTSHNLGVVHFNQEQPAQALPYLTECLTQAKKATHHYFIGNSSVHIGACHYHLGDYARARQFYQVAYDCFATFGFDDRRALCCHNLAEVLLETGEIAAARPLYQEGLMFARTLQMDWLVQEFEQLGARFVELSADFTPHEQKIIHYVRRHQMITTHTASNLLELEDRQALRILNGLCQQGVLQRCGGGRSTYYTFSS